jgi:hypothetical protein
MLSWFYYRGSEHDRRSSLANQWNTYRDFDQLLCIADPAGRLGRSLTSWPSIVKTWKDFCGYKSVPGGTPPPPRTLGRLEHLRPEDLVRNISIRKVPSGTSLAGKHLDSLCHMVFVWT